MARLARLISAAAGGGRFIKVSHQVTAQCDLSCAFCMRPPTAEANDADTASVIRCMDRFAAAGALFWSFNGGEPLTRRDLPRLIERGRDLGFLTTLVTNGVLLADRINEIEKVDHIEVSIDGPPEIHDRLRGAGTYDKAVAGLAAAAARDWRRHVFATLFSINAEKESLDHLLRLCKEHGAGLELQPALPWPSGSNRESLKPLEDEEEVPGEGPGLSAGGLQGTCVGGPTRSPRSCRV